MAVASALTEKAFAERRRASWDELDDVTRKSSRLGVKTLQPADVATLPSLYRDACADLAAAEAARYSAPLVAYLRGLTAAAHTVVYGRVVPSRARDNDGELRLKHTWLVAFPRAVRKRWRSMLVATALFFVPLAIGLVLTVRDPSFAFRVAPETMLRPLAEAYAHGFDDGRDAGEGTMMAGFYVYNNVGIALRCFALGIFGGVGSAFYLVQNGLTIGAILGYVVSQGAGANIGTFIIGHGSLELGAIVLAGGAGLSLGWSVTAPGELTRRASLQRTAREILVIVAGASVMLLMAAGIEAFWSASSTPRVVKLAVGGSLLLLVLGYVLIGGRAPEPAASRTKGGR
jgi:uncharacterized membrane protein SpoIIM required for sporulation